MRCHVCSKDYIKKDHHLYCVECGHSYKSPKCDATEYHVKQYRKNVGQYRDSEEIINDVVQPVFHEARKKMVEERVALIKEYGLISPGSRCLDVGCGAGTYAMELSEHVSSVMCLELSDVLVNEVRRLGFQCCQSDFLSASFEESLYDVVSAWHVLEHVEDIESFVRKMFELSDNGVVLEVPIDRKIPTNYDGHIHYFSKKSLRKLVERFARKVVELPGIQPPSALIIGLKDEHTA